MSTVGTTKLDVTKFVGSPSYELAVVVHRETEALRKLDALEFQAKHGSVGLPAIAPPGLLSGGPYDSSQFEHWGEYANNFALLMRCGEALGAPIGEVAKRIALELLPENAEIFFWMGSWLQALDQKLDIEFQFREQTGQIEEAKRKRSKAASDAAIKKNEEHAKAEAYVLAEWALRKAKFKGNRTKFAEAYVEVIRHELRIEVAMKTIHAVWLKGR